MSMKKSFGLCKGLDSPSRSRISIEWISLTSSWNGDTLGGKCEGDGDGNGGGKDDRTGGDEGDEDGGS